jgi:hypothetical protein
MSIFERNRSTTTILAIEAVEEFERLACGDNT